MLSASVSDAMVTEGDSGTVDAVFTITLDKPDASRVRVDFVTSDGTARAGSDYVATNGQVFFAPGETVKTVSVPILGDLLNEDEENFFLNLCDASTPIADNQGVGRIVDNNDPAPGISIGDATVVESDFSTVDASFAVLLSRPSGKTVTVNVSTQDGTALAGEDYGAVSRTVTFAPGETSQTVSVGVFGDRAFEGTETFRVNLGSPTNATIIDGAGTGTIQDNDPMPSISLSPGSATEGDTTTQTAFFSIFLSAPSSFPVTVNYATQDGTATAGSDYTATSGTVTFNPGETFKDVSVDILPDILVEGDESFQVNLSNATGATISDTSTSVTIFDNDPKFLSIFNAGSSNIVEGNSGTKVVQFVVSLDDRSLNEQTVTVDYSTGGSSDTATSSSPNADYQPVSGTLTFLPGETSKTIDVLVNGDTIDESDEFFTISLSNPSANAQLSNASAQQTIIDDDPIEPMISIGDSSVVEGGFGSTTITFPVTLSQPLSVPVTVFFHTDTDPSATNPADFQDVAFFSGSVTFNPGDTAQTVSVQVFGDNTFEPDETFLVLLDSNDADVKVAANQARGTIINDDSQPVVSIADSTATERNFSNSIQFTVSLSNPSSQTVSVDYATAPGTAGPSDFVSASGTLTFFPGQTSRTIVVSLIDDAVPEPTEAFTVNLSNAINSTFSGAQTATGTILDDDPSITIADATVTEGDSGTLDAVFTVTLNGPNPFQEVRVDYATADGSARAGEDYVAQSGTLIFPSGSTSQEIRVPIVGDLRFENIESFSVNLSNPVASTIRDGNALGTIRDNDARPTLSIDNPMIAEPTSGSVNAVFTVSLTAPSSLPVTLGYVTGDCSADAGVDYTSGSGSLTFAPGETSKTISVPVLADTEMEDIESFLVFLSGISGASVAKSMGQGFILANQPSPFLVTTADDSGAGSLRQAILAANSAENPGLNTITFAIPGGPAIIRLASALPAITDPVVIDGYTQPGAHPGTSSQGGIDALPLIRLDGSRLARLNQGGVANGLTILAGGANSTIRGLSITNFANSGIRIEQASGIRIEGDFIGTDASGADGMGNGTDGIFVAASSNNTIGGTTAAARNVISGNGSVGVQIFGLRSSANGSLELPARGNLIQGNLIGSDPTGTRALGNGTGVFLNDAGNNTVGGTTSVARNVISGNRSPAKDDAGNGVNIEGRFATDNLVQGNFIGVDASGKSPLGNELDGVLIVSASDNTIGGTELGAGNVIAGNSRFGVEIDGRGATNNLVTGNAIGTDVSGTQKLTNSRGAVSFFNAPFNSVQTEGVDLSNAGGSGLPDTVQGVRVSGDRLFATGLAVTFTDDLDVGRAQDLRNYTLVSAGKDRKLGTADDVAIPLSVAAYNSSTKTVRLLTARRVARNRPMLLTINGTTETALTNAVGFLLDGDSNGQPGGNFSTTITAKTPLFRPAPAGRAVKTAHVSAAAFDHLIAEAETTHKRGRIHAHARHGRSRP